MTKELTVSEQLIVDTINQTKDALSSGFTFAKDQVPDLIQQLIYWKIGQNIFFLILGLVLIWISVKVFNKIKEDEMLIVPVTVLAGLGVAATVGSTMELLQLTLAPKIYLIEYAASLMKN